MLTGSTHVCKVPPMLMELSGYCSSGAMVGRCVFRALRNSVEKKTWRRMTSTACPPTRTLTIRLSWRLPGRDARTKNPAGPRFGWPGLTLTRRASILTACCFPPSPPRLVVGWRVGRGSAARFFLPTPSSGWVSFSSASHARPRAGRGNIRKCGSGAVCLSS